MFSRLATLVPLAALVAVSIAAPSALKVRGDSSDGSCNPWNGSSGGSSGGWSGGSDGDWSGGSDGGWSGGSDGDWSGSSDGGSDGGWSGGSDGGWSGGSDGGSGGGSDGGSSGGVSQCNTSDQYCCNSAITQTTQALDLINLLGSLDLGAGVTCDPISVIGIGGNSCTQQPVCCTGNTFNGLINVACNPINVNL